MKTYRVLIPPVVEQQIWEQVLFIANDSVQNALDWNDRLRREILSLKRFPTRFNVDEDATQRLSDRQVQHVSARARSDRRSRPA